MFLKIFVVAICLSSLVNGDCGVVSKKSWGGLEPIHVKYLPRPVDLVIIQHTVTPSCTTDSACKSRVQNTQDYHMNNLNYWDIASSFYVGGNNKIYEGTGWLHVGAHTADYNSRSIGISFIGNYEENEPPAGMLNAVKDLLACGVENGHLKSSYKVVGHRQLIATLSPGRYLYNQIRRWPEYMEDVSSIKAN